MTNKKTMVSLLVDSDQKARIDTERQDKGFNLTKFVKVKLDEYFSQLDEVRQ